MDSKESGGSVELVLYDWSEIGKFGDGGVKDCRDAVVVVGGKEGGAKPTLEGHDFNCASPGRDPVWAPVAPKKVWSAKSRQVVGGGG